MGDQDPSDPLDTDVLSAFIDISIVKYCVRLSILFSIFLLSTFVTTLFHQTIYGIHLLICFTAHLIPLEDAIMASIEPLNIGFAGLGAMGLGMASHLVKEGHNVTGFDVYEPSLAKFNSAGGRAAYSPSDAAVGNNTFICMVANSQQAESVLFDATNGAVKGRTLSLRRWVLTIC